MTQTMSIDVVLKYFVNNSQYSGSKVIIFLENLENIDTFLSLKKENQGVQFLCVATSPEVCYTLDKKNISYVSVDQYLSFKEITAIGLKNFSYVEKLCEEIDRNLCKRFSILEEFSLKPARDNFLFFKLLFDTVTLKIKTIDAIIKKENPSLVLSFSKKSSGIFLRDQPFWHDVNLFDILLELDGWSFVHISIWDDWSDKLNVREDRTSSSVMKKIKLRCPSIYNIVYTFSHFGLVKSAGLLSSILRNVLRRKKNICISGFGYNWLNILDDLIKNQYYIIYLDYIPKSQKNDFKDVLLHNTTIKQICVICDIDFSDLFIKRSLNTLKNSLQVATEYPRLIENVFRKYHPCALLCNIKSNFIDRAPAHVARREQIPVISWQHGAAGFFEYYPILRFTELPDSNLHLVWGAGVKTQIENEFGLAKYKILPTGSFYLQELFQNSLGTNQYKILYITADYFYNNIYVGYSLSQQDNSFWITQKAVIDAIGTSKDKTALKLHHSSFQYRHFHDYIRINKFDHITIIKNEKTVPNLIQDSEIIIIDRPSTTLLEAVASKKIVFILFKHACLTDRAKKLLKKRAYCADHLEEFVEMIKSYSQGLPLSQCPDPENSEFLEEYGIADRDGNVVGKVIEALDSICSKNN